MGDITLSAVLDRVTDILWRQRNGEALEVPLKSLLLLLPRESERELAERKKKERKKRKNDVGILRCKKCRPPTWPSHSFAPPPQDVHVAEEDGFPPPRELLRGAGEHGGIKRTLLSIALRGKSHTDGKLKGAGGRM